MPIGAPDYLINSKGIPNILASIAKTEKLPTRLFKEEQTMIPQFKQIILQIKKTDPSSTKLHKDMLNKQISNSNKIKASSLLMSSTLALSACRDKHMCNQQIKR